MPQSVTSMAPLAGVGYFPEMSIENDKAELAEHERLLADAETGRTEIAEWKGRKGDTKQHVELLRKLVADLRERIATKEASERI